MNGWPPPIHPQIQPTVDHMVNVWSDVGVTVQQNWVTPTRCHLWVYDSNGLRVDARTVDFTESEAA